MRLRYVCRVDILAIYVHCQSCVLTRYCVSYCPYCKTDMQLNRSVLYKVLCYVHGIKIWGAICAKNSKFVILRCMQNVYDIVCQTNRDNLVIKRMKSFMHELSTVSINCNCMESQISI